MSLRFYAIFLTWPEIMQAEINFSADYSLTTVTQEQGHWKNKLQCILKYSNLNYKDKYQMLLNPWKDSFKDKKKRLPKSFIGK